MITKVCTDCNNLFSVTPKHEGQKRCQICIAAADDRIRSIPIRREKIFHDIVVVESLPGEWVEMPPKRSHDTPYWKIDISGRDLYEGRSDDAPKGRIIINATYPVKPGDKVRARVIRAGHVNKAGQRPGEEEVREYLSLSQAPDHKYPAWNLYYHEAKTVPCLAWEIIDGRVWRKSVVGGGRQGHLNLYPIDTPALDEYDSDFYEDDEALLGTTTLGAV
jgi:hypothetical protein